MLDVKYNNLRYRKMLRKKMTDVFKGNKKIFN